MMKKLLLFLSLSVGLLGADAANDLLLSQRKPDNSGNIQRNVTASANSALGFNGSLVPIALTGIQQNLTTGAVSLTAAGTNQNITLTPSGTGSTLIGSATNFGGAQGIIHLATNQDKNSIMVDIASSIGNYPYFAGRKANGTLASPTVITGTGSSGNLFQFNAFGYDGASFIKSSSIDFRVPNGSTIATNRIAGEIVFYTHPDSTSALAEGARFGSDQSLRFPSTNTAGLQLYNTADQTTNTKRGQLDAAGTGFLVGSRTVGTATELPTYLFAQVQNGGSEFSTVKLGRSAPFFRHGLFTAIEGTTNVSTNFTGTAVSFGNVTSTATSGSVVQFAITPTYNQASGTASNTDLLINRTETAVGSGAQYWEDRQVGGASRMATGSSKVLTTDATVTTVQTYTIPASTTWAFDGYVVARRTGGSSGTAEDGASYRVEAVIKNVAGTATSIGSTVTVIGESQAGWDVTVDVTGATARIRVTGAANNNVSWVWTGNVRQVSS